MYPKIIYKDRKNEPGVYAVVNNELEEITACRKMGMEFKKECPVVEDLEAQPKKRKKAD